MTAPDVPTRITGDFILDNIEGGAARILEVGCGDGRVAARLADAGHVVVALDAEAAAVASASARGVDARQAVFPDFTDDTPFDAVAFTRSLHHIHELAAACVRARDLLRPRGCVIVEDWAWNRMDAPTAEWSFGLIEELTAAGLAETDEWDAVGDRVTWWLDDHRRHGLHEDETMRGALAQHFEDVRVERVPYVYRYVARYMADHPDGRSRTDAVRRTERRLIAAGAIQPLGLRLVAR